MSHVLKNDIDSRNDSPRDGSESKVAMTPQQREFSALGRSGSELEKYRRLLVGDGGWGTLAGFELYGLCLSGTPGAVGMLGRRLTLPLFLKSCGRGLKVGTHVTIRQPKRIKLGNGVILDDSSVLDIRSSAPIEADIGIELGDGVCIGRFSLVVAKEGKIKLGNGCNVSSFCRIATQSRVELGESVLVAAYAYIGPGNHTADDPSRPLIEQPMDVKGGVRIGDNAWIGAHSTILDGVTIGREAVIGAHSLVRENVPDRAIVAGVPAKIIGSR